ncbi:MAG TPA: Hsp20/alpha crystallin family protein [Desulfuromonadales bacterium]|nr:Hsp20/alpha crystallin family protein [Desulfuromonadales bacterium]
MPRFSGRKPFQQEIFNRHAGEIRNLLHALEMRESFDGEENRPQVDVYETAREIVIEFDLPGMSLSDISVKVCGLTVSLDARKVREPCEGTFICVERQYGSFHHELLIPGNVDTGAIRAEYRLGVLRLICPKSGERLVPIKEI